VEKDLYTEQTIRQLTKIAPLLEEYHKRLEPLRKIYPYFNLHPDDPDYEAIGAQHYEAFRRNLKPHWEWLINQIGGVDAKTG